MMTSKTIVSGVFKDRQSTETALHALWAHGVAQNDVSLLIPDPGLYKVDDEGDVDWASGMLHGAEAGAPVGVLAGMTLMAIASPMSGAALFAGLPGGLVLGTLLGGTAGLLARIPGPAHGDTYHEVEVGTDELLVMVHTDEPEAIHQLLTGHGAVCFFDEMHKVSTSP